MAHEPRLAKLERRREEEAFAGSLAGRYLMARRACADGTADLAQYQLVYGAEVDATRRELRAMAPAMVARERLGLPRFHWQRLLAYPPDEPLTDELTGYVEALELSATLTLQEMAQLLGPAPAASFLSGPEMRKAAAIDVLAIGGHHGLGLRRDIWMNEDGQWVLSGRAMAAAEVRTIAVSQLTRRFDWRYFDKDPKLLKAAMGPDGEPEVSYANLAAHIDTWKPPNVRSGSEEVKRGQHSDVQ
jgi:hypothetical protein